MVENPFVKQMVGLLKNNVQNSFDALNLMQGQTEKIANLMMEQGNSLQASGKKFMEQWVDTLKKSQEEYHKNLQKQIEQLEKFSSGEKKQA